MNIVIFHLLVDFTTGLLYIRVYCPISCRFLAGIEIIRIFALQKSINECP